MKKSGKLQEGNKGIFRDIYIEIKIIVGIFCILCTGLSFLFYVNKNRFMIDGLLAPININIEIDKIYRDNLFIVVEPHKDIIRRLTPTSSLDNDLKSTIIHTELQNVYAQGISIRLPNGMNHDIISSINSISVFIGNKLFYFYSSDIITWNYTANEDTLDYVIPVGVYKKSFIKPWINWYGDINFLLVEFLLLLTNPDKFLFVYVFLLLFIILFFQEIQTILKKYNKQSEIILLFLLIGFGFLLRIVGMTRYSLWDDELFSVYTSYPKNPITSIIWDDFNPPLYYLLLRIWFTIFGWTEMSGRLLSVLLGTTGIFTIYFFVRSICGKKYAFLSALLLTISYEALEFSNEMRSYVFLIMLCPMVFHSFIHLLKNQNPKNSFIYFIYGMLLVNTHLYGIFLIAGNFFFYFMFNEYTLKRLIYIITSKQYVLERKRILNIILINVFIALSIIPFIIYHVSLIGFVNEGFTSWHPQPGNKGLTYGILVLLIYFFGRIFIILSNKYNIFRKNQSLLIGYSLFLIMFIYLASYLISVFYRNIFHFRYLSICLPLVITVLPIFIFFIVDIKLYRNYSNNLYIIKIIFSFALLAIFSNFISNWDLFGRGNNCVFKQSREYIIKDSINYTSTAKFDCSSHPMFIAANNFYGKQQIQEYSKYDTYDFIYINPGEGSFMPKDQILMNNGISLNNVLKIVPGGTGGPIYKIKGESLILDKAYKSSKNGRHIGEITGDTILKQTFVSSNNNLCEIQIMFATFARSNSCSINLQLYDDEDTLIDEKTMSSKEMMDNSYLIYKFDYINDSRNKRYSIVISSKDAVPGNAVTIWCTNKDSFDGDLFINGQQQTDNLCIFIGYCKQ